MLAKPWFNKRRVGPPHGMSRYCRSVNLLELCRGIVRKLAAVLYKKRQQRSGSGGPQVLVGDGIGDGVAMASCSPKGWVVWCGMVKV